MGVGVSPESMPLRNRIKLRLNRINESLFWILIKALYFIPMILSLSLPFATWDYLNVPNYQLQDNPFSFSGLLPNLFHSIFFDKIQFRPVATSFGNLQYALFGGEFWIWYAIRWVSFWMILRNLYSVLILLKYSKIVALASISIIALTATPLVLDLFTQDFLVVFFASLYLRILMKNVSVGEASTKKRSYQLSKEALLLFVWVLTLFSKEIGLIAAVWLFAFRYCVDRPKWKQYPLYLLTYFIFLVFSSVRMLQIHHPSISGSLISTHTFNSTILNVRGIFGYLVPYSWNNFFLIFLVIIILVGGISFALKSEFKSINFKLWAISLLGLIACAIFFSRNIALCPRYMAVPLMLTVFIVAPSVESIKKIGVVTSKNLSLVTLILIAILSPPKIYSSWFGMQQTLFNVNSDINYIYSSVHSGADVRWSGKIPVELAESTLQSFLNNFGQHAYGITETHGTYNGLDFANIPETRFVVWTTEPLSEFTSNVKLNLPSQEAEELLSRLSGAHINKVDNFGFFQNLIAKLKKLDQLLGSPLKDPIYCQQPIPSCFGSDFPNPDFKRQPWFIYQYGPYYFYEFSSSSPVTKIPPIKVIPTPSFLRYGSLFR